MAADAGALEKSARAALPVRRLGCLGLALVALFVLSPAAHAQIPPGCVSSAGDTVLTCSGNRQTGVELDATGTTYTTLNVFNLTTDIAPPATDNGIFFFSPGAVNLNIAPGPFAIFTTDADGVLAVGNTSVTLNSSIAITTTGDRAVGIRVGGQNDPVIIVSRGMIVTDGFAASGILVGAINTDIGIQSFGSIATQGEEANGIDVSNSGGAINIRSEGNIATEGEDAIGIYATSGSGAITIESFGNIATSEAGAAAINAFSGGNVTINSFGNIATGEAGAAAINALSAGDITINSYGNIATAGDYAVGISAVAALDARVFASGNIATQGVYAAGIFVSADTATVDSRANIFTQGNLAPGIVVEATGDATIISRGDITTTGVGADGILAISDGTANVTNYGNITAAAYGISAEGAAGNTVVNFGTVQGCSCAGIALMSIAINAINELTNYGAIIAAPGGNAIESVGDVNVIDNHGVITGNVLMSGFTSEFNNHAGALFNSGETVMAQTVINDGIIAPGGRGAIIPSLPTFMSDDFVQGASGIYAVDLDPAATVDRNDLIVVSNTAQLAGNVAVHLLSLPVTPIDTFLILDAAAVDATSLGLISSPALHAALIVGGNTVEIGIAVDFAADGLNRNQRSIAGAANNQFLVGAGAATPVLLGLLNVGSLGEYRNALDQLSPEIYSDAEIAALYSSLAFSNSLLSCKVNGTDTASIIREGQCLWAGASARFLNASTTSEQIGFDETAGLFTAGAQVALDDVWRLGVAGGFQSSTLQTATGATSDGSLGQAGVAVKYNPGPLLLAAAVTGGGATYDTRRVISFGGFTGVAESDQTLGIFSGALRAAYVLGGPQLYAKPMIDMNVTQLHLGSFTETGSAAALAVDGGAQTVFALAPAVEVGTEFWLSNGTLIRPLIRLGGIFYGGDDLALTAGFADLAPLSAIPGGSGFTTVTDIEDAMGLVGAGVEVINGGDAVLRLSYDGQLGAQTQIHSVGVKGSAKF